MLTHVAASSASSLVSISQESSTGVNNSVPSTSQLTSIPATTASSILNSGRKKARKTNPGLLQRALEADCEIVINPPSAISSRKRSRKQKISTLSEGDEIGKQVPKSKAKFQKRAGAKARKVGVSARVKSNQIDVSVASDCVVSDGSAFDSVKPTSLQHTSSVSLKHELSDIKFHELIDPKLSFKLFGDVSRNLAAISPSEVVVAVGTTTEKGSLNEIHSENGCPNLDCGTLYYIYKTVPHFLSVTGTLYARSEPLARILPFSQLEDYTCKVLFRNKVNTFRFSGNSFEKRLLDIPHADSEINKTHNEYRVADLIIKHPILNFYNRKSISLKFVILKRVPVSNTEYAVIKARIVKLHRSADLKNIEIFVDESVVEEKALDVNAMNQRNIQPVIQTPSGLVPVITNTNSYLQSTQSYQHQPHQYHYVQCQYEERNPALGDSAFRIANSFTVNNNIVPVIGTTDYPRNTIFSENGTQVLILNHSTSSSVPQSYLHQIQPQQIVQEGPSSSQLSLSDQLNARLQFQSEPQQQQYQDVEHQTQYLTIPTKDGGKLRGQIIVDPSQLANLQSRSNVPIRIIQSSCRLETGAETSAANLYAPSLHELKLPLQPIEYEAQSQTQPNYSTANLQQQVSGSVQIQQPLEQNVTEGEGNIEQSIQYTFPSQQSINFHSAHQEQEYLQPQIHSFQQQLQVQSQIQQISQQHQHQLQHSVVPDLSALSTSKQSLVSHLLSQPQCLPEPLPSQNFQHCSSSLSSIQPTSAPAPLAAPVRKLKSVKQPKHTTKKPKVVAACSHQTHSPPVSLSEQQLHQLQQRAKVGPAYEVVSTTNAPTPSGLLVQHSKCLTPTLLSSIHSSASSSTNPALLNAPKLQDPCASSSTSHTTVPEISNPTITSSQSTNAPVPKVITVIKSNTTKAIEPPVAIPDNRPTKKEGYLAVCPRCGVCTDSLIKCVRCKAEFPADVRLVKDGFKVSSKEAAVLILKPVTSSFLESTASDKTSCVSAIVNNVKTGNPTVAARLPKVTVTTGGRKIILVNKPAILGTLSGKEPTVPTEAEHVVIQQDGGSAVTILNSNNKSASKPNSKPIPKKRVVTRKRQQELITLSSDDEESDSISSVVKVEEKTLVKEGDCSSISIQSTSASTDQETSEGTDSIPSTPNMARKKGLAINLSPDMCTPSKRRKEEDIQDQTPEQIYDEISKRMVEPGCKFQYAMVQCRSVRIGSYKVTTSDTGFDIPVTFTELGIKFTLPHANFKHKQVKICIPLNVILDMTAHLHKKLPVIFISTGPKYARSVRDTLGLDGNPDSESSNFFCPQNGRSTQKKITLVASDIADADVGIIKSLYSLTLNEIDYHSANALLMSVTPDTYRGSISYSNDSPGSPPTPKIVSTTSVAPLANEQSQNSAIISTSSVVSSSSSCSTRRIDNCSSDSHDPRASQSTSSSLPVPFSIPMGNQDPGSAVLFYQGKNNVKMSICPNDISCLGHSQFLNDQIIDFWLAVIQTELLNDDDQKRTFVFDSFFYSKLTEKVKKRTVDEGSMSAGERRHARVKKRTKNVDIFEKDFLIVPINENYHWFIAIICFPGLQGYHDYESLELLPNYKRMKTSKSSSGRTVISTHQPKSDSTASYSNRDEASEDPEEMESQMSTEPDDDEESKIETDSNHRRSETSGGLKRKSEFGQRVKHPCILIFDSLAGDARGRVFSTLREYLKIEHKTKKHIDRIFDKTTMPGCMPKVPQQPNFSDCGLFLLQYVESFYSSPIQNFETMELSLKNWFQTSIAENKRREIYDFILKKVEQLYPQNLARIPTVNFESGDDNLNPEPSMHTEDDDSDDLFEPVPVKGKTRRRKSESDDHNYAKGNSNSTATTKEVKNE